jgi:hypothetical protein
MTQLADYRHRAPDSFRGPRGDYNGPGNGQDFATSVTVSQATGTVFVTGQSDGISTGFDYATIAYSG